MPLLRFISEATNIDFVKARFMAFAIDGLLLARLDGLDLLSRLQPGHRFHRRRAAGSEIAAERSTSARCARKVESVSDFKDSQIQYFGGGECDKPVNSCVADPRAARETSQANRPRLPRSSRNSARL